MKAVHGTTQATLRRTTSSYSDRALSAQLSKGRSEGGSFLDEYVLPRLTLQQPGEVFFSNVFLVPDAADVSKSKVRASDNSGCGSSTR
jgi:hypothetical protein